MADIRAQRFRTDRDNITTWHSFSYGEHYDPDNIAFGPIQAINDENLAPGAGYDEHAHSDVDIITCVLDGTLKHRDTVGQGGLIEPGTLQYLRAGTGVRHSEFNGSDQAPLRFLQIMARSDHESAPQYGVVEGQEVTLGRLRVRLLAAGEHTWNSSGGALALVASGAAAVGLDRLETGHEIRSTDSGGTVDVEAGGLVLLVEIDPKV